MDKITLSIIETLKAVIINEIGGLIYPHGKKSTDIFEQTSPYIKFLPITSCIEFMGACYDERPFETSRIDNQKIVETRFNVALKNLFDKRYNPFMKASSDFYLYKKLRNCLIHQLRPGFGIVLTTRSESIKDKTEHLKTISHNGKDFLVLVLEDFYDDLKKAAEKLIHKFESNKITNKKGENAFLDIISPSNN